MAYSEAKLNGSGDNVTYFTFTLEILVETDEAAKVSWVTIGVAQPEVITCDLRGMSKNPVLSYALVVLLDLHCTMLGWALSVFVAVSL